jgi:hypothetical protein
VAERPLAPRFVDALRAITAWLDATGARGVVIGGVAASVLGRPRLTGDIDALVIVEDAEWETFVAAGARFGIRPRRKDAIAFARRSRVLLLRHADSGIALDVTLGALPFEQEAVARGRRRRIDGLSVPLVTPEDLIVMKAVAHRPRDIADIEALRDMHPRLDRARILRLVREFAAVLDSPDLATEVERILGPSRPKKRRSRKPSPRRG